MNRRAFLGGLVALAATPLIPNLPHEKKILMPRTWYKVTVVHIPKIQGYTTAIAQRMREERLAIAKVLRGR